MSNAERERHADGPQLLRVDERDEAEVGVGGEEKSTR